ncbi:hypothetical protein PN36_29615 [Candidatus Thiomargarita nelsonii]|uniref:Uncharacterized protein n=1 Tax=Candidatus Thiomargarita nelsonii TaxID=1003181 RepID=A0A0A6PCV3_9GAMM|nr:hypothetical protein PN36_29615 [Candidatus Thiomargarita nelsonii]
MKTRKIVAIFVLVIVGTFFVLILSSPLWMGWLISSSQNRTYKAVKDIDLECKEGSIQKIQGWSKAGLSVSCRWGEIIHGPWQAWENGYIAINFTVLLNIKTA